MQEIAQQRKQVALRKESVDRNFVFVWSFVARLVSLSARRAWIEIANRYKAVIDVPSLSARRAWIEMSYIIVMPRNEEGRSPQGERG